MLPILAIIGRPNVGKSTLYNRLVGRRSALVDSRPGLTRDRSEGQAQLGGRTFLVTDTPGFETEQGASLEARMFAQTMQAVAQADLCLFMIDARSGLTALDTRFAEILHRSGKPVLLVANKCEGARAEAGLAEATNLGFEPMVAISAEHGEGMADVFAALMHLLPEAETVPAKTDQDEDSKPIRLAIVGRPNVGKSTLVNALLDQDRVLTGPEPGLTRDAIESEWNWQGRRICLVDTAGLRRRNRIHAAVEKMSVGSSIRAIKQADIVVLTMEAENAFERQDIQLADLTLRHGRGLVLACTQWDKIPDPDVYIQDIGRRSEALPTQGRAAPLIPVSGLKRTNLDKLMRAVTGVFDNWSAKVKTRDLNDWLQHTVRMRPPPAPNGKRIRPRYLSQISARPPTFVLMTSRASAMPEGYKRYLVKELREAFDLQGSPIVLNVRQGSNPYAGAF